MKRFLLAGAAALAVSFAAGHASAVDFTVVKTSMSSPYTANLSGFGIDETVRLGPIDFTTDAGMDYLLYCLDPFHTITIGNQDPSLIYDKGVVSNDFGGHVFTVTQLGNINWLLQVGRNPIDDVHGAAIQADIWTHEGMTVGGLAAPVQTYFDFLESHMGSASGANTFSWNSLDGHQSFGGGVPEPATWALLIMGFGGIGALIRRRRTHIAVA